MTPRRILSFKPESALTASAVALEAEATGQPLSRILDTAVSQYVGNLDIDSLREQILYPKQGCLHCGRITGSLSPLCQNHQRNFSEHEDCYSVALLMGFPQGTKLPEDFVTAAIEAGVFRRFDSATDTPGVPWSWVDRQALHDFWDAFYSVDATPKGIVEAQYDDRGRLIRPSRMVAGPPRTVVSRSRPHSPRERREAEERTVQVLEDAKRKQRENQIAALKRQQTEVAKKLAALEDQED